MTPWQECARPVWECQPAHYSPDWLPCGTHPHLAAQVLRTLWVKGQSLDHQKGTWGWGGCGRPAKVPPSLSHVSGGIMWTGIRCGVSPNWLRHFSQGLASLWDSVYPPLITLWGPVVAEPPPHLISFLPVER